MKVKTSNRLKIKEVVYKNILANHIFTDYLYTRDLVETCRRIELYSGVIKKYINSIRQSHNIHFRSQKKWNKRHGFSDRLYDFRTGDETYGYKSIEEIEGNLNYISDRFAAEFRLQWLLDVPKNVAQLSEKNP